MSREVFREDLLVDQHVMITGGSRGIGFGIARRLAEKGANLTLIARTQDDLDEASHQLEKEHDVRTLGLSADVREYETLEETVRRAADELGPINHLICGAAGNFPAAASEMSSNAFASVVDIDLNGTFNTCRATYEHFAKENSTITAISATHGEEAIPFQSHACAAKAGIESLVRTLSVEWADDDIRVNAVQPGPIDNTKGMKRLAPDEGTRDKLTETLPAGRLGTKRDVADLILYLISPAASFVTGAVVPVDGGLKQIGTTQLF